MGEGPISDYTEIMAARVPFAPLSVSMVSQSATSIAISWETPNNGGTAITTYKIYSDLATNGVSYTEIEPSTGLVNSYFIASGIEVDKVYRFKVRAINVLGQGDLSEASAGIRAATIPDKPTDLVEVSSSDTQLVISWVAPIYNGGNAVTDYLVYKSIDSNSAYTFHARTGSASVHTMTLSGSDVLRGSTFWFKVTAENAIG